MGITREELEEPHFCFLTKWLGNPNLLNWFLVRGSYGNVETPEHPALALVIGFRSVAGGNDTVALSGGAKIVDLDGKAPAFDRQTRLPLRSLENADQPSFSRPKAYRQASLQQIALILLLKQSLLTYTRRCWQTRSCTSRGVASESTTEPCYGIFRPMAVASD